jgi:23S rRNA (cytosine1962-C5)-methyltransferase
MNTLFRNNDWLIINKPPGLSSHGAWAGDTGVVEWLHLHQTESALVVSRLDKETSGVMVLARHREASAQAETIHRSELALKTYLFVTDRSTLGRDPEWTVDTPLDQKPAQTTFRILERWPNGLSLLEAKLRSGKKHQVRRHASDCGLPLLGDTEYGGGPFPRVCLHAASLFWPPLEQLVHAPTPLVFEALRNTTAPWLNAGIYGALARDQRGSVLDQVTTAQRLVHRGECHEPIAIDRFGSALCVWDYRESPTRDMPLDMWLGSTAPQASVVVKRTQRNPHRKGALCTTDVLHDLKDWPETIREHDLQFNVDLFGHDQTGFFIDQRDNRRRLGQLAQGAHVANLFSYTCSFSVVAAHAGCERVVSVDNSRKALSRGIANLRLNQLESPGRTQFVHDDVRAWLARQQRKGPSFDVVICDPPTFAAPSGTTGAKAFLLEKEWAGLTQSVAGILNKGGHALFCCNARSIATSHLESWLERSFDHVVRYRPPLDFPEHIDDRHNRFFWCRS